MKEIEAEGKNIEDAVEKGLKELNANRDDVEIKVLSEGKSGLFGLMGAVPAKVKLTLKKESEKDVDMEKAKEYSIEIISHIVKYMGLDATIDAKISDNVILANIKTEDSGLLIGPGGQTLNALQDMVRLILKRNPDTRVNINIDTEDYKKRQEEKIISTAKRTAQEVKKSGVPKMLPPMPSALRRTIHSYFQNDPDIETVSEGDGYKRSVVIKLKK